MVFVESLLLAVAALAVFKRLSARSRAYISSLERQGAEARDWLQEHLAGGPPVAVASTRWNVFADRILFHLADGSTVKLFCFWPRRVEVSSLVEARFWPRIGWALDGCAPNGDQVRFFAWRVVYNPAV